MDKKVLITGSTGLVGSHLLRSLNEKYQIHAISRQLPTSKPPNISYYTIDFASNWEVKVLPGAIDTVIHLAQSPHIREFPDKALDVFKVNIESTAKLLDYAATIGVTSFIYASSGGVYGNGSGAFRENSPIQRSQDLAYYLGSKVCGEVLVQSYSSLMDVIILRPFFMYGTNQRRSMLLPRLADRIRNGQPITLQGSEGIKINPVHVSDCVTLIEACLQKCDSQVINVAGSETLSIKSIAKIIGKHLNVEPVFEYLPGEPRDLIGNNDLIVKILAKKLIPFHVGVKDIL